MQTDQKKWWVVKSMFFVAAVLLALVTGMASAPSSAYADGKIVNPDDKDMWISVGMGLRGGFAALENGSANGGSYTNSFGIDYARIYINGGITKVIKYEFNTECFDCSGTGNPFGQTSSTGAQNQIGLLDAIGKLEFNQYVNVWAGRLLVPASRGELNGPFFSATFNQYRTPFESSDFAGKYGNGGAGVYGRDNGITFWGQADRLQYSAGVFTGLQSSSTAGPNQQNSPLFAGRLTYNFFNPEKNPGYYTSGTYYGKAGDILALAVAAQHQKNGAGTRANQADLTYITSDLLFEKPLGNSGDKGVITINAEYQQFFANYNNSATTGAFAPAVTDCFCMFDGNSFYVAGMYLFPNKVGMGQFQPYARFTSVQPNNSAAREETEVGTNYIISGFNARFATFWQYGDLASLGTNYASNATGHFANAIKFAFQFQY
ncbi:MAG: hypothetical protein EXR97_05650 [Nitrospiraceae bacterium]|nr:hypothetical protein [Nitrospiraceae bacterium]MSR23705.1 hypothetical protein [Nitrospiraceae bacterium]